nr:relaxin receptor 2-like [Halyomorpha halys]
MWYLRAMIIMIPLTTSLLILISIIFFISLGSCPEGYFSCGKSNICIIQKHICDGHKDCPNADDEEPMYCADLYGGFWEIIDSLRYKEPNDTCVLNDIPDGCNCSDYTVLICTDMSLQTVPSYIPEGTKRLILAKNNITIKEVDFHNHSFHIINLADNNISTLPKKTFHGQVDLMKLFLFKNYLSEIPKGLFYELNNLTWLFLNENNINNLNLENWDLQSLIWLDLSHNKISLETEVFPNLSSLTFLYLDWNLIEEITENTFSHLSQLIDLSISWNKIKSIHPTAFQNLSELQDLNLRSNELMFLSETMFLNNRKLQKLNLGGNIFLIVTKNLLLPLQSLRSLQVQNLEDIDIDNYNATTFSLLLNLEFVYFKRFKYCMYVPNVPKCYPSTDGTSSKADLLVNELLRGTLWMVVMFTLITNGIVLWHRMISSVFTSPLNLIITNLAGSDLLMGCYLLIIGCQDLKYKGIFITHAREWMSSWLCTTAGILAMTSCEVTVLLLFLISAERYLLIAAPLRRQKTLKPRVAFLSVSSVWIIGFIISSLPVFNWKDSSRFYGTNTFCFPLHIDEPYRIGWHYSTFVFIGLNSLAMFGIGILYYGVLLSVHKTRRETTLNVGDTDFVMRFFFIVLTNACCWVPIIILKILAFLRIELSGELNGWLAIFVLPINSAVNPILYTFTTPHYTVTERDRGLPEGPMTLKRRLSRAISMIYRQQAIYEPPKTQEEEL